MKLIPGKSVKAHAARIRRDIIKEIKDTFKVGETILFYNIYNIDLLTKAQGIYYQSFL